MSSVITGAIDLGISTPRTLTTLSGDGRGGRSARAIGGGTGEGDSDI